MAALSYQSAISGPGSKPTTVRSRRLTAFRLRWIKARRLVLSANRAAARNSRRARSTHGSESCRLLDAALSHRCRHALVDRQRAHGAVPAEPVADQSIRFRHRPGLPTVSRQGRRQAGIDELVAVHAHPGLPRLTGLRRPQRSRAARHSGPAARQGRERCRLAAMERAMATIAGHDV